MNLIQKKQMKRNLDGMKQTNVQCIEFLEYIQSNLELTDEQKEGLSSVIVHQQNMNVFLTNMSERV